LQLEPPHLAASGPPAGSASAIASKRGDPHLRRNPGDDRLALAIMLAIPLAATLHGLSYYVLGPGERLRSSLHAWLKPSAGLGLAFGIAGLCLFLFMWLYPVRKKLRLPHAGSIATWLRVHVLVGITLPIVIAVHAGWRFEGLIGLGYASMVLVSLSGFVGRYLYVRIPRSQSGLELTRDQLGNERRAILTRIAAATGRDPIVVERAITLEAPAAGRESLARTLARLVTDDLARWRRIRSLRREWGAAAGASAEERREVATALRLARREIALDQQARMLEATRRVFGFWHVAHRPVAITALLAILIHVAVAVFVGGVGLPGGPR
jgi:hypothetical protein